MKVFVRSTDLANDERPLVMGFYDDASEITGDAHGPGMTMLTVAPGLLVNDKRKDGSLEPMARLSPDWRQRSANYFPPSERLASLYAMLAGIIEHGADVSKWPASAKDNYDKIKQKWA